MYDKWQEMLAEFKGEGSQAECWVGKSGREA